jgi:hypothetical protein
MKKAVLLAMVLVFGVTTLASAGLGSLMKAIKGGDKHYLTLSQVNPVWKKYEDSEFDPIKENKEAYSYTTYGDPQWDKLVESCARAAVSVSFAEKIASSAKATPEDAVLASSAVAPLAKDIPTLVTSVVQFGQGVASDPTKAAMLKDVKAVGESIGLLGKKIGALVKAIDDKVKAAQAGGVPAIPAAPAAPATETAPAPAAPTGGTK